MRISEDFPAPLYHLAHGLRSPPPDRSGEVASKPPPLSPSHCRDKLGEDLSDAARRRIETRRLSRTHDKALSDGEAR
jgi:hypothetical protein